MTSTERKRKWRLAHPEQSREAERQRAHARRLGFWGDMAKPCQSSESYARYEATVSRWKQRAFYPRYGAGAHRLTRGQFRAAGKALIDAARANALLSLTSFARS